MDSLCASWMTSLSLFTLVICHAGNLSSFSHYFTSALVANTGTVSSILFLFSVSAGSRDWLPSGGLVVLRRRVVAGLDDVSCGNDVGDVLAVELEEPVDNLGTTIGT